MGERVNVKLALESVDWFSSTIRVARVLDNQLGPPYAVALWDLAHQFRVCEPVTTALANVSKRFGYFHVKDAFRHGDNFETLSLDAGRHPLAEAL